MRLDNRFPPPPPRRSWIFTMGELLHVVLVATCYPLVNHRITVQSQKTRVTSPHKSRRMFRPSLCDSCECSPQLIRFHALFSQMSPSQIPGTLCNRTRSNECVYHFNRNFHLIFYPGHDLFFLYMHAISCFLIVEHDINAFV